MGAVVTPSSKDFGQYIQAEMRKWSEVIARTTSRFSVDVSAPHRAYPSTRSRSGLFGTIPIGSKGFAGGCAMRHATARHAEKPASPDVERNDLGQAGMWTRSGRPWGARAHPRQHRFRAAVGDVLSSLLPFATACAEPANPFAISTFDAYVSAFGLLDRQDIAALALTLGILCFAVVTAILLVRTRQRLAAKLRRDESIASKAAIDRAYALLLSEPQILVAWAAAADERDHRRPGAGDRQRRPRGSPGTWLDRARRRHGRRSTPCVRAASASP
jgi:hypothetical protein